MEATLHTEGDLSLGLYRRRDGRHKHKTWWISYMAGGRQHRESSGSKNKRDAEKLLAIRKAEVLEDRLSLPRSHAPHFGDFSEEFLKSTVHPKTRARYRSSMNNLLQFVGGRVRLSDITPAVVFHFQQSRLDNGAGKATVNRDIAALSALFSRAKKMRLILHNPCSDVGKLNERRDRRQAKPLDYEEEKGIKQFAPFWLQVLITLLVETGLRVGKEALSLCWTDVALDVEPACIRVRDSKSAAGIRAVWLTQHCRETLMSWRNMFGPQFSQYVFPSPRNPSVRLADYRKAWAKAAQQAGLSDRRLYDLRATFASRANACRASALTVAQLLGHASTHILPTYVKPLDENTKALIEALDIARNAHSTQSRSIQ